MRPLGKRIAHGQTPEKSVHTAHGHGARTQSGQDLATPQKKARTARPTPEKQSVRTAHGHGARTEDGQDLAAIREALLTTAKA